MKKHLIQSIQCSWIFVILSFISATTISGQIDLELSHALKVGISTTEEPGIIRWNDATSDFEGYDGQRWWSLTKPILLQEGTEEPTNFLPFYGDTVISNHLNSDVFFGQAVALEKGLMVVKNRKVAIYEQVDGSWLQDTVISPQVNSSGINDPLELKDSTIFAGYPNSMVTGEVHIINSSDGRWDLDTILNLPQSSDFGSALAYNGKYLAIGAKGTAINNVNSEGKVFIYERREGVWHLYTELPNPNLDLDGQFGRSIDIDDNSLIVGAQSNAYLYGIIGDVFSYRGVLPYRPSDVALNTNQVFISNSAETMDFTIQGAIYVINKDDLSQVDTLIVDIADLRLGSHISVNDSLLLASAESTNFFGTDQTGSVYVYHYDGSWNLREILTDPFSNQNDEFGRTTDLLGVNYMIGVPRADVNGINDKGKVILGSFN